jgi:hypothetical protein
MLLADVNEDLCRELTSGEGLETVRKYLFERFGGRLDRDHNQGRHIIRGALEEHFHLDNGRSRKLFALLEDVRFVRYVMEPNPDIRKTPPSYMPGEGEVMAYGGFYSKP